MNIKQLIKDCHEAAIKKGFYDCKTCEGKKHGYDDETGIETCPTCGGTGINENRNIGELLMLIVSELSEALEAHRINRFADLESFTNGISQIKAGCSIFKDDKSYLQGTKEGKALFEWHIKDTFEDEIADTFIRLFDLCGYLKIEIRERDSGFYEQGWGNVGADLFMICRILDNKDYSFVYNLLRGFCKFHKIDIEKHIIAKMEYNKTRPHKHNKGY